MMDIVLYRVLPGRKLSRHPDVEKYGQAGIVPAGDVVDLSHLDEAGRQRLVGKYVEPVEPAEEVEYDEDNEE